MFNEEFYDADRYYDKQEAMLMRRPVCDRCHEHIQETTCIRLPNDELWCEECERQFPEELWFRWCHEDYVLELEED